MPEYTIDNTWTHNTFDLYMGSRLASSESMKFVDEGLKTESYNYLIVPATFYRRRYKKLRFIEK